MGAPVREFDDGKLWKTEPPRTEPPKTVPAKDTPKDVGVAPSSYAREVPPSPPWKRKRRHEVFEGDVAVKELRSALAPERIPEPISSSTAPTSSGRLMSGITMTAVVAGVAGFLWGAKVSTKGPEVAPASGQANVLPAPSTPVTGLTVSNRDLDPPAASRTASIGLSPVDTHGAQGPALLPTPRQTVSPSVAPQPPVVDASVIAAKMKIGVELMTYGEVTAARVMFQRVAEASDGAGAFALAETYDPLVLGGLRLRERVMPNIALARTWYERARDLGSLEARDRISRLAQFPQ
jgi:hypothetical protein